MDFPGNKPTSYWGTPISGHLHKAMEFKGFINQQTSLEAGIVGRWFLVFLPTDNWGGHPFSNWLKGTLKPEKLTIYTKWGPLES